MIYVSTGGVPTQKGSQTALELFETGIKGVELSGGLFDPNLRNSIDKLLAQGNLQIHNYFPPPNLPFVINLASDNQEIIKKTQDHILSALQLSVDIGSNIYSFHAGYLIDPDHHELGRRIENRDIQSRAQALEAFIANVNQIARKALDMGTKVLIENNVLSASNFKYFKQNPFLMVNADECEFIMSNTLENVGMLLDMAHLKVSAQTLGFDVQEFIGRCNPWVEAYHLSDNDGTVDSNQPVCEESWFWDYLKKDVDFYTLEVYGHTYKELLQQESLLSKKIEL